MPETNETYHPMTFDAIKIGLASPEKIRSWREGWPVLREDLRTQQGLGVPLRQVQEDPL